MKRRNLIGCFGREVAVIVDKRQTAGTYKIDLTDQILQADFIFITTGR